MATSTEIRKNINNITSKPTTNDSSYKLATLQQDLKVANKEEVFNYLMTKDIPYDAVLGLMGNIDHETGGAFDYTKQQYNGGPGYGLFQKEGLKKQAYDLYTENRPDSLEAQVDFMVDSIYNPNNLPDSVLTLMGPGKTKADIVGPGNSKNLQEVFANGSVEDVTTAFMNMWEMPKDYILHQQNPENQTYYENYQENLGKRIADANTAKSSFLPPTEYRGEGLGKVAIN